MINHWSKLVSECDISHLFYSSKNCFTCYNWK